MWDWELIKSGSSQGRYEVLVQYTHEDFHYAHAISYDTEQNEYCLHNHALYELVYCVRGDVIYQAEGVRYQMEPHSLLLLAPAVLHKLFINYFDANSEMFSLMGKCLQLFNQQSVGSAYYGPAECAGIVPLLERLERASASDDERISSLAPYFAKALVAELLKGPADPTLKSPFPKGTALLSAEQKGTELRVDLSAAYSTLSGVGLSLADYAITLTLTQLPDVAHVRITVAGRELDYRSRQVFLARDILTVPKEDVVGTVDASLYFVNGDGALTAEARTLNLYEGDTQVSAVVRALENGPETKGLSAVLPEGFKVRKVWLEEEICYVSLSSALLEGQPEPETLSQAVLALEQSLLSLESVEEVRFLVDGELADTYGPIDLP